MAPGSDGAGWPGHPLYCRCLPCARSPIPSILVPCSAVLVASHAVLCPSSLSDVLALVPPSVAPAFCVSVLLLPLSVGALGAPLAHPLLPHPPGPPVRGFHISVRRGLSRARLAGHGPVATPVAGTSRRAGCSPCPCGVRGHLVEGGGRCCPRLGARDSCESTPWLVVCSDHQWFGRCVSSACPRPLH